MPDLGIGEMLLASSLIGGTANVLGSMNAAKAQTSAASQASATTLNMFNQAKELAMPFISGGADALGPLARLTSPGADMTAELEKTPGYQFALSQGEKGITNQATMRGLGGNVMRAGGDYAKGLAETTWGSVVDKLLARANIGSTSASGVGGQATAAGKSISDAIIGSGNANAAKDIGIGNAVSGVTGNMSNMLLLNALTGGKLFGSAGGMFGASGGGGANPTAYYNPDGSGYLEG